MLVAGNICNYIQLSKESPGLEEIPGIGDNAALWVEKRWKQSSGLALRFAHLSQPVSVRQMG